MKEENPHAEIAEYAERNYRFLFLSSACSAPLREVLLLPFVLVRVGSCLSFTSKQR